MNTGYKTCNADTCAERRRLLQEIGKVDFVSHGQSCVAHFHSLQSMSTMLNTKGPYFSVYSCTILFFAMLQIAQVIISQYGGPDGELAASMRYLAQRYTMPYNTVAGLLTDIGTEELAHFEMICAIVYQLTRKPKDHTFRYIPVPFYFLPCCSV